MKGPAIEGAKCDAGKKASHIVQLRVTVNCGNHRNMNTAAQNRSHQITARAMTVDNVISAIYDFFLQLLQNGIGVAAVQHVNMNTQFSSFLNKGAVGKADHICVNGLI